MIKVIISHPNGQQQEVILAGVPRVNDHIRLSDADKAAPALVVDFVLWQEGNGGSMEPTVVVVVHPHREAPPI